MCEQQSTTSPLRELAIKTILLATAFGFLSLMGLVPLGVSLGVVAGGTMANAIWAFRKTRKSR